MCQHHIIHVNKNPVRGEAMDHRFCVSKQGVGLSLTSPPLKAHSWRLRSEERGYSYTNGDMNCPRGITSTEQLFLSWARNSGWLRVLNINGLGVITVFEPLMAVMHKTYLFFLQTSGFTAALSPSAMAWSRSNQVVTLREDQLHSEGWQVQKTVGWILVLLCIKLSRCVDWL